MTDNCDSEQAALDHIDAALAEGERPPGINMGIVLIELGNLLVGAGSALHLRSHDFVRANDVRDHIEMVLRSTGSLLWYVSEEGE